MTFHLLAHIITYVHFLFIHLKLRCTFILSIISYDELHSALNELTENIGGYFKFYCMNSSKNKTVKR